LWRLTPSTRLSADLKNETQEEKIVFEAKSVNQLEKGIARTQHFYGHLA
jgi:hypothetical protein